MAYRGLLAIAVGTATVLPLAGARAQCMAPRDAPPAEAFASGERPIFTLDLARRGGASPPGVRFAEGSLALGEHEGKPAIVSTSPSLLVVPLRGKLPERFTIEMTVVHRATAQVGASTVRVYGGTARVPGTGPAAAFEYGTLFWAIAGGGARAGGDFHPGPERDDCIGAEVPLRLQVDGDRIRAWAGDRHLAEVRGASFRREGGLVIELEGRGGEGNEVYLTAMRVAGAGGVVGAATSEPVTPVAPGTPAKRAPGRLPTELAARTVHVPGIVASGAFPSIDVPRIQASGAIPVISVPALEAIGAIPVVQVPKIRARGVKAP